MYKNKGGGVGWWVVKLIVQRKGNAGFKKKKCSRLVTLCFVAQTMNREKKIGEHKPCFGVKTGQGYDLDVGGNLWSKITFLVSALSRR